jgi:hypothetical protein
LSTHGSALKAHGIASLGMDLHSIGKRHWRIERSDLLVNVKETRDSLKVEGKGDAGVVLEELKKCSRILEEIQLQH